MANNAKHDENHVPTAIALNSADGTTIVPLQVNPSSHRLTASDGTTGTDFGPTNASRDQNFVPVLMAVSSADGITPVAVYADSNGKILIDQS